MESGTETIHIRYSVRVVCQLGNPIETFVLPQIDGLDACLALFGVMIQLKPHGKDSTSFLV